MVLLFIGLAIKLKKNQFFQILSLLLLRASVSMLIVGVAAKIFGISGNGILFMLVFSLSACSFWPYAHMASIDHKESNLKTNKKTFDTEFALTVLAISLPLSVSLILGIFSVGDTFTNVTPIFVLASSLFLLGSIFPVLQMLKSEKKTVVTSSK